jgi:hypothetical protein
MKVGDSNLMEQTSVFLSGLASAVNATPQSAEDQLGVFRRSSRSQVSRTPDLLAMWRLWRFGEGRRRTIS